MRFLCLHGRGTNSDIFESQLAPLLSQLTPTYTYDYIDGEHRCPPAPGIHNFYAGPYLCYYAEADTNSIRQAHTVLREILDEDGPFDGVIAFSQGAALAASLLISQTLKKQDEPLPFRFAVFIAGGMPLSPWENVGKDVTEEARGILGVKSNPGMSKSENHNRFNLGNFLAPGLKDHSMSSSSKSTPHSIGSISASSSSVALSSSSSSTPPSELDMPVDSDPDSRRVFSLDPSVLGTNLIAIPTLHIIGTDDPWKEYSMSLLKLCQQDLASVYFNHGGGHEVPRAMETLKICAQKMARLVETASLRW